MTTSDVPDIPTPTPPDLPTEPADPPTTSPDPPTTPPHSPVTQPDPSKGEEDGSGRRQAALTRELGDLLIELSIGIHKHAIYPPDHPSLAPAAESVTHRLDRLLNERATLSIGVARQQLVIEGVATDSKNPVLTDLASRLHAHYLGAIAFSKGVTPFEVEKLLKQVAIDADRSGAPIGLGSDDELSAQPHIRLYPVAYDRLQLVDDDETQQFDRSKTHAAQLWVGLAQAALALDEAHSDEDTEVEPSLVARAIRSQGRGTAYDQVIVGYLLQIADEVKDAGGAEALALKNRLTDLIAHLDQSTLEQLLKMGGDSRQRRKFLLSATQGMSVDAVIKLVHAASQSQGQSVSNSMLRILQKLSQHAQDGTATRRMAADRSIRDQITELIEGWSLTDPNPDEYTLALQRMARSSSLFRARESADYKPDPKRLVQMAIEVNTSGPTVQQAVNELVANREVKWLVEIMNEAKASDATVAIWSDLATTARLAEILTEEPLDVEALDGILPKLGSQSAEPMIEALIEAESRQVRRVLLDRLVHLGPAVAPLAVARLADSRWFVQRNMLTIIGEMPELPQGFSPDNFFGHPDARVRREALRIMIEDPRLRERAVCHALSDDEERTVRLGLAAALDDCPKTAIPLLVSRVSDPGSETEIRTIAIRVLGATEDSRGRDVLIEIAAPRRTLFRTKLPTKTPEYLAALNALAAFRDDPRVRPVLLAAAQSKDREIVRAAAPQKEPLEVPV